MKFKKLEVAGFKSFADKLEIKFGNGVTAIVGPNGCGKSNVADAIRWVLGEQSAKLLRGQTMQDVIFGGTANRKSLSYCEVHLYFDNTDKALFPTLEFNEVVISRKLYRSGESEYLLNKSVVRLKDITDILRDANMGKEGYSIIGQGRIEEILSSKPEDRRAIFEEAAGISKHKSKKREAERRLERVQNELNLAQVSVDEKAKQLDPLTRQAENARKWLELRDRLKTHEINMFIHQQDTASEAKAVITTRLNGVLEQISLRQKENEQAAITYNTTMQKISDTDQAIHSLRDKLLAISVDQEKMSGEIKLVNERIGYTNLQSKKLDEENQKLESELSTIQELIQQTSTALSVNKEEYETKKKAEEELSFEYIRISEELSRGEGEVETRHQEVVDAMDKLTDIRANMSRLLAEREALSIRLGELGDRIKFNSEKLEQDEKEQNELKCELERLTKLKDELIKNRENSVIVNNESLFYVNQAAKKLDKLSESFYTLKTRQKLIKEIKDANEGFSASTKRLLQDAKTDKSLSDRIEGFVAQLIKVKEGFETAIEMALGNSIQNIVTKNEDDAKFLINYLKKRNYGRVTFLPITSIKPRSIDPRYNDLLSFEGCFGTASSLISFDKRYEPIISGLLGGTVIVDNMDNAVDLAKRSGYSFRIVTLEGDIIDTRGSITGGSKKSDISNIFAHDRELAQLEDSIKATEQSIESCTTERAENAKKAEEAQSTIRQLREQIHALEIDIAAKNESYKKLCENNVDVRRTIANLEFESLESSERADAIDNDLNSVSELENIVKSEKDFAAAGGQERIMQFDSLRQDRSRIHNEVMDAKMALSALDNSIQNCESEIRRLQENVVNITEKLENNYAQINEYNVSLNELTDKLNSLAVNSDSSLYEKSLQIKQEIANFDQQKKDSHTFLSQLDEQRMALMGEIQALHEKKSREEMLLLKVDSDIEVLSQRIEEEYNLKYSECLAYKEANYDYLAGSAESSRIKRQMSMLGNVNVDAIEQCKVLYAEYNLINEKREDLIKSKADLEQIIAKFSDEMTEKFAKSFEQIRTNFQAVFKSLFDGGTADLYMVEGENILEAGIEIIAQPPEKKLQSMSLLSGGERALTAIAILFAILKLSPMPFCVLDEIEAALDDTNAARFAKYLRRFSEETQFIVITHRKPTMELSDNLYGVTMEEKGISKIVSVKLSEAVAVAEQQNS